MKREKFLWPITHAHHFGLMAGKELQRMLEGKPGRKEAALMREKAEKFFREDLATHVEVEEKILNQLTFHLGRSNELLERARREHREMLELLEKGDVRSLELFAAKLIRHIYFEEDELFPKVEEQFTVAEKEWVETELRFDVRNWPSVPVFGGT